MVMINFDWSMKFYVIGFFGNVLFDRVKILVKLKNLINLVEISDNSDF